MNLISDDKIHSIFTIFSFKFKEIIIINSNLFKNGIIILGKLRSSKGSF